MADLHVRVQGIANRFLILLDVMMPGKSGIETCEEVRISGIRGAVVLMTGIVTADEVAKAYELDVPLLDKLSYEAQLEQILLEC
jgi:CheY-like chemotaxis protein